MAAKAKKEGTETPGEKPPTETPPKDGAPTEVPRADDALAGLSKMVGDIHARIFPKPKESTQPKETAPAPVKSWGAGVFFMGLLVLALPVTVALALWKLGRNSATHNAEK